MVEIVEEVRVHPVPVPIIGQQRQHNIVSGESEDIFSTDDDDEEDEEGQAYLNSTRSKRNDKDNNNNDHDPADLLYDENLDDLDEAYVYKNMRGGIRESVTVLTGQPTTTKSGSSSNTATATTAATEDNPAADGENAQGRRRQSVQVYKPRSSDAVLSCPCCFNIVCMDCQKHKRYPNQYRAMFVMGVVVDWNNILVYDDTHFKEYEIIYLVMKGRKNNIELNGYYYSLQEIAELFEGKMKGKIIHFSNSKPLDLKQDEAQYFLDVSGARAVSGYGLNAVSLSSLPLDLLFFGACQEGHDLKSVVELLYKRNHLAFKALDFRIYY